MKFKKAGLITMAAGGTIAATGAGLASYVMSGSGLAVEALKRAIPKTTQDSAVETAQRLAEMDTDQINGLTSNVKGVLFEKEFSEQTGATLHAATNHPATDAILDGSEIQLKASDNLHYVETAADNNVVYATSEVASLSNHPNVLNSNISNQDVTEQASNLIGSLEVAGSMIDVGLITVGAVPIFALGALGYKAYKFIK